MTEAPTDTTMYQRLKGVEPIRRIVESMYHHIVRDDELFLPYFRNVEMHVIKAHMVALVSMILGGPTKYSGRDLPLAHENLGITSRAYDRVGDYLIGCLYIAHADQEIIETVMEVLRVHKPLVVTR